MSKKADISFIKVVKTTEDWTREVVEANAPIVVDVYTKCWGACDMLNDKFTTLYFELAEDSGLKFVRAEADKIGALVDMKDQCQPTFLFYKGGEQIQRIDGPKVSTIISLIKDMCGVKKAEA